MNNILKSGLCTLLLGATLTSYDTSEKVQKDALEMVVTQNSFISPEGYYSLGRNPKDFGYSLQQHGKLSSPNSYGDIYVSSMGQINISSSSTDKDLETLFEAFIGAYMKNISDALSADFKTGEGVRIVGKGPNKKITIDGNPALQGGCEWWTFSKDIKGPYNQKYDFVMTLAKGKKNMYLFSLYYLKDGTDKEVQTNAFYNEILKSFHALK